MTETLEASGAALTSDESEVEEARYDLGVPGPGLSCFSSPKSLGKSRKIAKVYEKSANFHERSTKQR